MFVTDVDTKCLRQGDILAEIPFPLINLADLILLGKLDPQTQKSSATPSLASVTTMHREDPNWLTAQLPVRVSFCAVISQCCDLEPRHNKIKLPAFAVARLIPIPKSAQEDEQKLERLKSNKDPRDPKDPGYLNFFYIPPHERLNGTDWVVDYNQTMAIRGGEFPDILRKKVLQMDDTTRVKFKIKLAACLARLTAEEQSAGLHEPWKIDLD